MSLLSATHSVSLWHGYEITLGTGEYARDGDSSSRRGVEDLVTHADGEQKVRERLALLDGLALVPVRPDAVHEPAPDRRGLIESRDGPKLGHWRRVPLPLAGRRPAWIGLLSLARSFRVLARGRVLSLLLVGLSGMGELRLLSLNLGLGRR